MYSIGILVCCHSVIIMMNHKRILPVSIILWLLSVVLLWPHSFVAASVKGWSTHTKDDGVVYQPKKLDAGVIFSIKAYPVELYRGKPSQWFHEKVKTLQMPLGTVVKNWTHKVLPNNAYLSHTYYRDAAGRKLFVGYHGGALNQQSFYILQIINSGDKATTRQYSHQLKAAIAWAKTELKTPRPERVATHEGDQTVPPATPLPALVSASMPKGLIGIWGALSYGLQAGGFFGSSEEAFAVFSNGTATTDIAGVFNLGIAQSQANEPHRWGYWRKQGNTIVITWPDRRDEYDRWWKNERPLSGQRIEGCFARVVSSSGGAGGIAGAMVGASKTWCFSKDGRFSNRKNSFGFAPNIAMNQRSNTIAGRYYIDGFAMKLAYDSGENVTVGFSYLSDKQTHIGINGVRYLGGE